MGFGGKKRCDGMQEGRRERENENKRKKRKKKDERGKKEKEKESKTGQLCRERQSEKVGTILCQLNSNVRRNYCTKSSMKS